MTTEEKINEILITLHDLKTQVNIIVADAESEKDTRRRRNMHFDQMIKKLEERVTSLERSKYQQQGGLIVLGIISTVLGIASIFISFYGK